jgi:hypothetical protein
VSGPYGLDRVGPRWPEPKRDAWRRAALTEPELGLRAAAWNDQPYDLYNALAAHRAAENATPTGQLDMFEDNAA